MPLPPDDLRALLLGLLDDAAILAGADAGRAAAAFRVAMRGPSAELLGALLVPTSRVPDVVAALPLDGAYDPLPVELVADSGVVGVEQAKNRLVDRDEIELRGVRLALPRALDQSAFVPSVLESLAFSVPAAIEVGLVPGWEAALDALGADGAERVGVRVHEGEPAAVAALLAGIVGRRLPFVVTDGAELATTTPGGYGLLNLLAATCAARRGSGTDRITDLLTAPAADALWPMLTDPLPLRASLRSVATADAAAAVAALAAAGLAVA